MTSYLKFYTLHNYDVILQWVCTVYRLLENFSSLYGNVYVLLASLKVSYEISFSNAQLEYFFSLGELLQSNCECLQSVSENWLGTLELLLDGISTADRTQKLYPIVGEFLSLTVEMFRHKHIDLSPAHKNGFLQCVLNNLLQLLSLVKMCESVYIFKRFIDVALKSEEKSCSVMLHHYIIPSLTALLGLPVCKEIAKCWLEECGDKLPISVTITHTKRVSLECGLNQSGLIATCVRKTILVSIKCITRLLHSLSQQQHPSSGTP